MTLIAASGFSIHDGHAIAVVMAGGHGQLFVQCFQRAPFGALGPLKSLVPEEAAAMCKDIPLALGRSEERTSELQSLMRISYAVFCWKKKTHETHTQPHYTT